MKKWTKEICHEESKKYNSRSEFSNHSQSAYNKSLKNDWLDEICSHMVLKHKSNGYWTKDRCHEVALKYNHRGEFRKNDASVYRIVHSKKWIDELCSHMNYVNEYWNYEKCKIEALKHTSRTQFQKKSKGAYRFAHLNDFLDNICSHMIKIGNRERRCVYVFEFNDNCAYIGLTYNLIVREIDHNRKGPVYLHLKNTIYKYKLLQLTDYIKKEDAQKIEEEAILKYENDGWMLLNSQYKSTLGGNIIYWTYEKCKEEALKYKYRNEFRKINAGAYNSAWKNKWLDDICVNMKIDKSKRKWTDVDIEFLIKNKSNGLKYCANELNKSYISVKNKSFYLKKKNLI